jgi:hypothetical protein
MNQKSNHDTSNQLTIVTVTTDVISNQHRALVLVAQPLLDICYLHVRVILGDY